ncbi:hypothetical protein [Motiliproteus sp. MSK22-1]|uniref:hypothetical protein n=1 Tax=Motiliproteus sp. MSK22-1 TaxID=1897630 RepID=UPI000977338D|nr:hypothetical protein [Motiliproteus sp. MSK22-1]OMH32522.1 hypothetical protein BGP75_15120 [Motiliproteus sp. MSK22-1]
MATALMCEKPTPISSLNHLCDLLSTESIQTVTCEIPTTLSPYTPYLVGDYSRPQDRGIINPLASMPQSSAKNLMGLVSEFGEDRTVAMAQVMSTISNPYSTAGMGAATSVYGGRVGAFADAVKAFEDSVMQHKQAVSYRGGRQMSKVRMQRAYEKMNRMFRLEIELVTAGKKIRKGHPLANMTRAKNIAESGRSVAKLDFTNQIEAHNLVKFSKHTKVLGNGLAVIDFTSRVGDIHNTYKAGGNWEKKMFVEASGFAVGAVAGTLAVNAGLALLALTTPVGWVYLIGTGAVIIATAAGVSMAADHHAKKAADWLYDPILNWINSLWS